MATLKGKTLVEQTTEHIIQYITDNQLKPGDQLPTEAAFTAELGVSRGTLRDAFKVLIARNILEARQGSGTFISHRMGIPDDPLGLTFIYDDQSLAIDMLDIRLMLEPTIAQLAAINATDEQISVLKMNTKALERNIRQGTSYADEDARFHQLVAEASGNRIVGNLTHILFSSIYKNIELTLDVQKERNTLFYHKKILQSIIDRDSINAQMYMYMHLSLLKDYIISCFKKKEMQQKRKLFFDE